MILWVENAEELLFYNRTSLQFQTAPDFPSRTLPPFYVRIAFYIAFYLLSSVPLYIFMDCFMAIPVLMFMLNHKLKMIF